MAERVTVPDMMNAREARAQAQRTLLARYPGAAVVCLCMNIAGPVKRTENIERAFAWGVAQVKAVLAPYETLFDAAIDAGRRPIIISTEGDSISKIFLNRKMDYLFCKTPDDCNAHALDVLRRNEHDLVVVYNGNYDAQMHRTGPESREALAQLRHNTVNFEILSRHARQAWAGMTAMTAFLPDHGCHEIDGGLGSHGLDMPEDLNIVHFYNFFA